MLLSSPSSLFSYKLLQNMTSSYYQGKVLPPDITKADSDPKGGHKEVNWVRPFLSDESNILSTVETEISFRQF